MSGPEQERGTVVAIVVDDRGWMICGTVDGVAVDTPKPLSARAAAHYLRIWLPQLCGEEPQHLTTDETAADSAADAADGSEP